MALIVQKYGGTSVGSIERIQAVARRIARIVDQGHQVVAVVSAMAKDKKTRETERLLGLAQQLDPPSPPTEAYQRELDMLVSTGEQVSIALVAIALQQIGCPAISLTGAQASIRTTRDHTCARIVEIGTDRILNALSQGKVVVVAGFQGIHSPIDLDITTLGRGGSDTSAVALAVALQAEICEIYTDVPGVFTTDPSKIPEAHLLPEITCEEMLELASLGAKVLHPRAVELARNFGMKVKVLSSFIDPSETGSPDADPFLTDPSPRGTVVMASPPKHRSLSELEVTEAVDEVIVDQHQVKIVLLNVPDRPGIAAHLFRAIAAVGINVDLILQSIHVTDGEPTNDIAFTVPQTALSQAEITAKRVAQELGCPQVVIDPQIAKVSLTGAGMIGRPGIAADMFQTLARAGINIQMISMSEIKVSCVIAADQAGDAALYLADFFQVIPHPSRSIAPQPGLKPVRGVALDENQSRLAILQVPDQPGYAAHIFLTLAQAGVQVDTIIQSQRSNFNAEGIATNDIAFTVPQDQASKAEFVLRDVATELACDRVYADHSIAKVSIVGAEMEAHPGTAALMFEALAAAGINIEMIATSEIKVSCVVQRQDGLKALQQIHQTFQLHLP